MSQSAQSISNGTGAAVRAAINTALAALFSTNSGSSAPSTTVAHMFWADTTTGVLWKRNAANTGWLNYGTIDETYVLARSSNTILDVSDSGKAIVATSTFTQTFDTCANLKDGWNIAYKNNGAGAITLTAGSGTIDGASSIVLSAGQQCVIWCNGTNLYTYGIQTLVAEQVCQGRLTLTSGLPVTSADVTGATNVYFTPHTGNYVSLYTGSAWLLMSFTELTLALGTVASGLPYDIFLDYNSGTPQLAKVAWTDGTTRATALAYQNGVLVKSGAATQRYLGTIYTTSTTTTEDSVTKRYLWNYYNRVTRSMQRRESTASWAYSTNTYRQANGATANQLNFVVGVAEEAVSASVVAAGANGDATNRLLSVGIGINSTSTNSAVSSIAHTNNTYMGITSLQASLTTIPPAGVNYLAWLELGAGASTQTWQGNSLSGITGNIRA